MSKREISYIRVNPAGNITAFVMTPTERKDWAAVGRALMKQVDPSLEQVGFVSWADHNPSGAKQDADDSSGARQDANRDIGCEDHGVSHDPSHASGHKACEEAHVPSRMDMMGGEFCGNASRSFALLIASKKGIVAPCQLKVSVSGADRPLLVSIDPKKSLAALEMEEARTVDALSFAGQNRPVVVLPGIVHMILKDEAEDPDLVQAGLKILQQRYPSEAYGVIFFNAQEISMVPYVYVAAPDTLYREGSCGSGTVAVGTAYFEELGLDTGRKIALKQPAGSIELSARKDAQGKVHCTIGGPVEFQAERKVVLDL